MPRLTRAKAAEVAEQMHVDEDAILEENMKLGTPEPSDRNALEDLAPNSAGSGKDESGEVAQLKKSTRGRKAGKKGGKGKKDVTEQSDQETEEKGTVDDQIAGDSNAVEDASRSTRSRTAKRDDDPPTDVSLVPELVVVSSEKPLSLQIETAPAATETAPPTALDAPASPLPTARPNVITSLRKDTPGRRTASNKENIEPMESPVPAEAASLTPRPSTSYDALEAAVVEAATPPIGPSRRTSALDLSQTDSAPLLAEQPDAQIETIETPDPKSPIEALDALDDAIEKVSAEMQQTKINEQKFKAKKAAPVVRTTKASQARISLAHPGKVDAAAKPAVAARPRPSTLARASSVRQSTINRPDPAAKKRIVSAGNSKSAGEGQEPREKKQTVIPHSKPRPVGLSFPTPPPPPKSRKAPTQSAFQLPGEAVAAKLKAAREERLKKEAEAPVEKKPAFKARPVPTTLKQAPSVRQTNASQARQSLMNGGKPAGATSMHKRAQSAVTASTTTKPRVSSLQPPTDSLTVAKRPSTALANIGKPRSSIAPAPAPGQRVASAGKGTVKGKEVFNRAAAAKEAAEREKREKEEAAKKARAAAAERGRQLSREWAEKQKAKKMAAAAVGKSEGTEVVDVAATVTV